MHFTLNGKRKKSTIRKHAALKLAKDAAEGDKKALKMLLEWERAAQNEKKAEAVFSAQYPLAEDDCRTIDNICARIRATLPQPRG